MSTCRRTSPRMRRRGPEFERAVLCSRDNSHQLQKSAHVKITSCLVWPVATTVVWWVVGRGTDFGRNFDKKKLRKTVQKQDGNNHTHF
jgi:hypothetical protein